jgi:nucleoid-associated protein YgaU
MSVLRFQKDPRKAPNGKIQVWNPKKTAGSGWQWISLLTSGPKVWSDLTPWGFSKRVTASSSATLKKAHAVFLRNLKARAAALAQPITPVEDQYPSDPVPGYREQITGGESLSRSIGIIETDYTKTRIDGGIWFPIAPEQYDITQTYDWEEIDIIGLGRTAHAGIRGLREVTIEAILPGTYDPTICLAIDSDQKHMAPGKWISKVSEIADALDVFRLIVGSRRTGDGSVEYVLNALMRIVDFSWGETAGRPFDRTVRITFSEWRPQSVKFGDKTSLTKTAKTNRIPKTHKVKKGEDYKDLARRYYRNVKLWKNIASHNKDDKKLAVESWTSNGKKKKDPHEISFKIKVVKLPTIKSK